MFLKRVLVLMVAILLFIGAFLFKYHLADAQLEDGFKQQRLNYGVDGTVLVSSDSPPPPIAPPPVTPPTPPPASAPAPDSNATPPPGSAPDTNTIIGPVPPSPSTPMPDTTPTSAPTPPPAPDTNSGGPMAPTTSTRVIPREEQSSPFQLAAYKPSQLTMLTVTQTEPTSNAVPQAENAPNSPAFSTNSPTSAATPSSIPLRTETTNPMPTSPRPADTTLSAAPAISEESSRPVEGEASVIVLLYHQFIPPGAHVSSKMQWTMNQTVFESEMKYIHDNGYHVVPISDVLRFIKHEITLPPGSVAITIDDGYKSAIVYAAPILKKYGYPWTFFIYPAFITVNEGKGAASWHDLQELQSEGVDIECHSMTHPQLTRKGSKTPEQYDAWLTNETANAKAILEKQMGKTINCFAYPYGDYNKQVEAKVIAAGFEAIFTVADNPVHSTTNLHSIGRYTITQSVEKNFPAYLHQSALSLAKADPEPGATIANPRPVITAVLDTLGAAKIDPASIETSVRDFGVVRHDFDPQTDTVRLYLPRDLIQQVVLVNIRVKDTATQRIMVANWHFNYEPAGGAPTAEHAPIATEPAQKAESSAATNAVPTATPAPAPINSTATPAKAGTD